MSRGRCGDDLVALVSRARQVVELVQACAERLRSEHDGDRIDVALLVLGAELEDQAAPARLEGGLVRGQLGLEGRLPRPQIGLLRLERPESRVPCLQPGVERVEAEQRLMCPRAELLHRGVGVARLRAASGARSCKRGRRCEREHSSGQGAETHGARSPPPQHEGLTVLDGASPCGSCGSALPGT